MRGLAFFGIISASLFGFLTIASEMREGETHAFDDAILRALRSPTDPADPIGPFWIEAIMRDLTALGGYTVLSLILVLAVTYLLMKGKRASALMMAVAVVGGVILSNLLKIGFDRQRPDVVAHLVDVHSLSFPSGHAMLSAVTYLTLGALLARSERGIVMRAYFMGVAIVLTLLIGSSRVYLGVHYPTDVLAGWCAGSAWAFICWWVARWLQHRGSVEPSS
ncbi:phosphatase PAP2 family protein [Aureimonas phyllosphaerae]|uniref:Undecaprenyl-diphosphatase n=1 Tax=Aureimonas phyllosphaerae TaxID=1166078 RepID=A0A7W6BTT1_9HYPH|nr:phosphatase PAP2 family protein [Aureimonas phyllosphaerae]MBB3934933.1 undecaprenyl-diphosphatase [Aureimonas phyllosphaerae]MBB3958941.1 undecaprenyl-diphosphatase [Aureimonas phyllosphaerae]